MIERVWEWHFTASPERLGPLLADAARFNEAIGLPRYAVSETPLPDGSVRRVGSARLLGVTIEWEEGVPEWVAPRRFWHERRFRSGPLRRVENEITLDPTGNPAGASASLVRYRLGLEPRHWAVALALRPGFFDRFGRRLDRLFREAADLALADPEAAFQLPPPTLTAAVRDRVAAGGRARPGRGDGAAGRLARQLFEAR